MAITPVTVEPIRLMARVLWRCVGLLGGAQARDPLLR